MPKDRGQQFKQPAPEQKTEQPEIIVDNQPARVEIKISTYVFWVIGTLFLIAVIFGLPMGVAQKDESALSLLYMSFIELVFLSWIIILVPPAWPVLFSAFFFYYKARKTGKTSYLRIAETAIIAIGAFLAYSLYDLLANEQSDS